ncbi:MAG: hypothetical protein AAFR65_15620 [Pseudomonadota bacterium]
MECHETFKSLWTLPAILVLMSCGSATSEHLPTGDVETCIINYSVHPVHGGARMGDARRAILRRELSDGFDGSGLASDLEAFSARIIEEMRQDLRLPPFRIEQVRGGYKGSTSDSLTATARYRGETGDGAFAHLTSAVGYVFMQDGVILQCSPAAEDEQGVPALVLGDTGRRDDLNANGIGNIYASMLDVTGFDELGFTYDPAEDTMTILIFSDDGAPERQAMGWAISTLNTHDSQAEVMLSEDERAVSFLGHRWEDDEAGTSYRDLLGEAFESHTIEPSQLDRYQRTYLSIIDAYAEE